jgi:hypothetical protein
MTRQLPEHPNLDHLKKQARRLLDDRRQHDPAAQLSDALHALAREYGFVTWPELKAHVEALRARAPQSPFTGYWAAMLDESRLHPVARVQSAMLHFAVDGDSVTISNVVHDASGKQERGVQTIRVDGQAHASPDGYELVARWLGARAIETTATKDGRVVGQGVYELSTDASTLTISSKNARGNADGWAADSDSVVVLRRPGGRR